MAFFFTDGELSINGVPIGKVENVEFAKHDNSVKIPEGAFTVDEDLLSKIQPISPSVADEVFLKTKEELERKLFQAMGVPPSIFNPLPEWVGRVIRIPERRIRQIMGSRENF